MPHHTAPTLSDPTAGPGPDRSSFGALQYSWRVAWIDSYGMFVGGIAGLAGMPLLHLIGPLHEWFLYVCLAALGLLVAYIGWVRLGAGLDVYEHGVVRRVRGVEMGLRSSDIRSVYRRTWYLGGPLARRAVSLRFELEHGPDFTVSTLLAIPASLLDYVAARFEATVLGERRASFRRGVPIRCGAFSVERDGIGAPGGLFPWGRIAALRIERRAFGHRWALIAADGAVLARVREGKVGDGLVMATLLGDMGKVVIHYASEGARALDEASELSEALVPESARLIAYAFEETDAHLTKLKQQRRER
jgi:hypothetical protein